MVLKNVSEHYYNCQKVASWPNHVLVDCSGENIARTNPCKGDSNLKFSVLCTITYTEAYRRLLKKAGVLKLGAERAKSRKKWLSGYQPAHGRVRFDIQPHHYIANRTCQPDLSICQGPTAVVLSD